jgi:hypothetical protein
MTRQPTTEPDPRGLDDDHQIDLALELARLDRLHALHWPRAMKGDVEAAEELLEAPQLARCRQSTQRPRRVRPIELLTCPYCHDVICVGGGHD